VSGTVSLSIGSGNSFIVTSTISGGVGSNNSIATLRLASGTLSLGRFSVGGNPGTYGAMSLEGASAAHIGPALFQIGLSGNGVVQIKNLADLTSGPARLGVNSGGVGELIANGAGATWAASGTVQVGISGAGKLSVINGAEVTVGALDMGAGFDSTSNVLVKGAGAVLSTSGTVNFGGTTSGGLAAEATLSIENGGNVTFAEVTNVKAASLLEISGGMLSLNTVNHAYVRGNRARCSDEDWSLRSGEPRHRDGGNGGIAAS
jgi:fibronectin-binding autotransporter adhesin